MKTPTFIKKHLKCSYMYFLNMKEIIKSANCPWTHENVVKMLSMVRWRLRLHASDNFTLNCKKLNDTLAEFVPYSLLHGLLDDPFQNQHKPRNEQFRPKNMPSAPKGVLRFFYDVLWYALLPPSLSSHFEVNFFILFLKNIVIAMR